jgi:signal peptidase II
MFTGRVASTVTVVKKNNLTLFLLAATVVTLDQLTKLWIAESLPLYGQKSIIPGFFNLVHVTNTGVAFGLLAGDHARWRRIFFIAVALVALVVILTAYRHIREKGLPYVVSIGFIAGGAIGNLIDRIRFGAVVDFLDFYIKDYHWPAFNLADSAITVGVGLFLLVSIFPREDEGRKKNMKVG